MLACCVITAGPWVEDTGTPPASCRDADGATQHRLHPTHFYSNICDLGYFYPTMQPDP